MKKILISLFVLISINTIGQGVSKNPNIKLYFNEKGWVSKTKVLLTIINNQNL